MAEAPLQRVLSELFITKHNVHHTDDSATCSISGICWVWGRKIAIADKANKNIKLLNNEFQIINVFPLSNCFSQYNGSDYVAHDICSFTTEDGNRIAVTICKESEEYYVCFLEVQENDSQYRIIFKNSVPCEHEARGLFYKENYLYVGSRDKVFEYRVTEGQGKVNITAEKLIHREKSDDLNAITVNRFAFSEDELYITNNAENCLMILRKDQDGQFYSPGDSCYLCEPAGLCLADTGTLLVCGNKSILYAWKMEDLYKGTKKDMGQGIPHNLQFGPTMRAELSTNRVNLNRLLSVCHDKTSRIVLLGGENNDNIAMTCLKMLSKCV